MKLKITPLFLLLLTTGVIAQENHFAAANDVT